MYPSIFNNQPPKLPPTYHQLTYFYGIILDAIIGVMMSGKEQFKFSSYLNASLLSAEIIQYGQYCYRDFVTTFFIFVLWLFSQDIKNISDDIFTVLAELYEENKTFPDSVISDFPAHLQFYISYLNNITLSKNYGVAICLSVVTVRQRHVFNGSHG